MPKRATGRPWLVSRQGKLRRESKKKNRLSRDPATQRTIQETVNNPSQPSTPIVIESLDDIAPLVEHGLDVFNQNTVSITDSVTLLVCIFFLILLSFPYFYG